MGGFVQVKVSNNWSAAFIVMAGTRPAMTI
jgi:hypothetical protein